MKKVVSFLLTFALLLSCTGCSQRGGELSGISQEEYDALKGQYEDLQKDYQALQEDYQDLQSDYETLLQEAAAESEPESSTEEVTEEEPETVAESAPGESGISDGEEVDAAENTMMRGGTNQNDAVLLPMNTKLYGTVGEQGLWYSFTTDSNEDNSYQITVINKTLDSENVAVYVYDELGTQLAKHRAGNNGIAATCTLEDLLPNTTYYLRILSVNGGWYEDSKTVHYVMTIKNPAAQLDSYSTTNNLTTAVGLTDSLDEVHPGTNQDDAAFIPTDVKLSGTTNDTAALWYAFTTNSAEGAYQFITVNETVDSQFFAVYIYNELGTQITKHRVGNNGIAATCTVEDLLPNTTYYFRILSVNGGWYEDSKKINYTLTIRSPEEPERATATVEQLQKDSLVFETPFELNSTQVMFVANKAVFIDEAAAKAALEPVAEVILAHPDHPILLAGTTATDGTQESCVKLSNKRAEAVKNLLVSAFGVPESQIQTIGLGYEADPFVRGKDRDANGKFVESEGAKNRRVVVLDIEDPIAQELLNE